MFSELFYSLNHGYAFGETRFIPGLLPRVPILPCALYVLDRHQPSAILTWISGYVVNGGMNFSPGFVQLRQCFNPQGLEATLACTAHAHGLSVPLRTLS